VKRNILCLKVLFVCNQGKDRSPTAAIIWKEELGDQTDFMGVYNEDHDHGEKLDWADLIIVMEQHQRKWIGENFPDIYLKKKILCLDIPDVYGYMKPDLVEVLKKKITSINK